MYQWIARNIAEGMIASDFRISSALGNGQLEENAPLLLLKQESPLLYVTAILNGQTTDLEAHKTFMSGYLEHLKQNLSQYFCTGIICLSIIVDNSPSEATVDFVDKQIYLPGESLYHIWWYATAEPQQIYTGKDQPTQILNIHKIITEALKNPEKRGDISLRRLEKTVLDKTTPQAKTKNFGLTFSLFFINALVLAVMLLQGTSIQWISAFGCSAETVLEYHQYYRLFTCMFLHSGFTHLLSNGIYLYFFGTRTELLFGKVKMLLIYFLSGLTGSIFGIFFTDSFSVGASGAIFGLVGAILVHCHKKGRRSVGMNYTSLLLFCVVAVLIGFLQTGVNSFAHLGGFAMGVILSWLFLLKPEKNQ